MSKLADKLDCSSMINNMKDKEIRKVIKNYLFSRYGDQLAIIEELKIDKGNAYPDLVAFFSTPHCYEIKSHFDTLSRLERQIKYFAKYFGKVTIICAPKHTSAVLTQTPEWIGVTEIDAGKLFCIRKSNRNPDYDKLEIINTLWKEEVLNIEADLNIEAGKKSRTKEQIIKNLRESKKQYEILPKAIDLLLTRMSASDRLSKR